MRVLIIMLFAGIGSVAQAGIYKWIDPDTGNVVYSDQPRKGAEQLNLPQAQTFKSPPLPPTSDTGNQAPATDQAIYTKFAIVDPQNEATIRNTAGVVDVTLAVSPTLKTGQRITLVLDDKREYGPTSDLQFSLKGVDRGTHTLQAMIQDAQGQIIQKSSTVTIFVKQASALQPKPKL
jgi:hypothetical protein